MRFDDRNPLLTSGQTHYVILNPLLAEFVDREMIVIAQAKEKDMKYIAAFVLPFLIACVDARADSIVVNDRTYKISELLKLDKAEEDFKRVDQKLSHTFYGPVYMAMFEKEQTLIQKETINNSGADEHQKKLATQGLVLGAGAAKGLGFSGVDLTNLAVSFIFSGVEDQAVRIESESAYSRILDGSIQVNKWYPGVRVTEALANGYGELTKLLELDCQFKELSSGKMWRGRDHFARITGKCTTNSARPAVIARNSNSFKYWEDAAGSGTIVMYTFAAMGRSQDEMRALGRTIRQALSKDWYVMQAETLTNQATGQPEKMYLISKDGVMKAYPLPPPPVFK